MAQVVNTNDFDSVVLQNDKKVLVDFFAPWCGPCQALVPVVDELSEEMKDEVVIVKVNIDESPELAQKYAVMSIPTLKVFNGGEVVAEHVGAMGKDALKDFIKGA